jgi:PleD family two-component response regulator
VKSRVDLHSSSVSSRRSGLGQGSTFSIRLPWRNAHTQPATREEGMLTASSLPADSLKILVVDDNVDAAEMLKLLLEATGHEVQVAHGPYKPSEQAKRY